MSLAAKRSGENASTDILISEKVALEPTPTQATLPSSRPLLVLGGGLQHNQEAAYVTNQTNQSENLLQLPKLEASRKRRKSFRIPIQEGKLDILQWPQILTNHTPGSIGFLIRRSNASLPPSRPLLLQPARQFASAQGGSLSRPCKIALDPALPKPGAPQIPEYIDQSPQAFFLLFLFQYLHSCSPLTSSYNVGASCRSTAPSCATPGASQTNGPERRRWASRGQNSRVTRM